MPRPVFLFVPSHGSPVVFTNARAAARHAVATVEAGVFDRAGQGRAVLPDFFNQDAVGDRVALVERGLRDGRTFWAALGAPGLDRVAFSVTRQTPRTS